MIHRAPKGCSIEFFNKAHNNVSFGMQSVKTCNAIVKLESYVLREAVDRESLQSILKG